MKQFKKPVVRIGEVIATERGWEWVRQGFKNELLISLKGLKSKLVEMEYKNSIDDAPKVEDSKPEPTPAPDVKVDTKEVTKPKATTKPKAAPKKKTQTK